MENNHIKFDFLGKDSIRYENEVQVHERVYALVKQFCGKDSNGKRESLPLIFHQHHRSRCPLYSEDLYRRKMAWALASLWRWPERSSQKLISI